MLLKIGTQKYHLTIAILYFYDEAKTKQLNLFEFIINPFLFLVVTLWKPKLYIGWKHKQILWIRDGEVIFNNKFIRRENAKI